MSSNNEKPAHGDESSSPEMAADAITLEHHGIDYIGPAERHGRPLDQLTIRFSPCVYLAPLVIGALAVNSGLDLAGTISAVIIANILGGIIVGLCAVMGPRLGMPQMVLSRMVFGYRGTYFPAFLATIMFVGYFAVGVVLSADAFVAVFPVIPYVPAIIVCGIIAVLITVYGHNMLHLIGKGVSVVTMIAFFITTIFAIIAGPTVSAKAALPESEYWLAWSSTLILAFAINAAWGPAASDVSRYLPEKDANARVAIWAGLGVCIGYAWPMILGALLASTLESRSGDIFDGIANVLPPDLGAALIVIVGIASVPHSSVNQYAAGLSTLTWGSKLSRINTAIITGIIGVILAIVFRGDKFLGAFQDFLIIISYFIMPWLGIILADFYIFRRLAAPFPRPEKFHQNYGELGGINWSGIIALIVGLIITIPLMSSSIYVGYIGSLLGLDVSYFVSFIISGVVYLLLAYYKFNFSPPDRA